MIDRDGIPHYIEEPKGWKDDGLEFARNKKYQGVIPVVSSDAQYYGVAKTLLDKEYESYGVIGFMRVEKWIKDNFTDKWKIEYTGYLDFNEIYIQEAFTTTRFNTNGLVKDLKVNKSKLIELDALESLKFEYSPQMESIGLYLKGKSINTSSQWNNDKTTTLGKETKILSDHWDNVTFTWYCPIPVELNESNDSLLLMDTLDVNADYERYDGRSPNPLDFCSGADRQFLRVNSGFFGDMEIKLRGRVYIDITRRERAQDPQFHVNIVQLRYSVSAGAFVIHRNVRLSSNYNWNTNGTYADLNFDGLYEDVQASDNFCLYTDTNVRLRDERWFSGRARLDTIQTYENISMTVSTQDTIPPTKNESYRVLEVLKKLMSMVTESKNTLSTSVFEKGGEFYNHAIANGVGIRSGSAYDLPAIDGSLTAESSKEGFKPIQAKIGDILDSLVHTYGLGIGIVDNNDGTESLVIEDLGYFYNGSETIDIGEVTELKKKPAGEDIFSELEYGYAKGDDLDGMENLDEFNTSSNHSTPIDSKSAPFKGVSKFITGQYLTEFTRINQINKNNKESYTTDNELFLFDCKEIDFEGERTLTPKLLEDFDGSVGLNGVAGIDTSFNFFFSPKNMIYRNSNYLNSAFVKLKNPILKFISSKRSSTMRSNLYGLKEPLIEGSDYDMSLMKPALFDAEYYEFNKQVTQEIYSRILGQSEDGRPNFYSLIRFSFKGQIYFGYLWSLKPKGRGAWKLKKANI